MKKAHIVIFALLVAALSFSSCETLARAFAGQTGRNFADALFDASERLLELPP